MKRKIKAIGIIFGVTALIAALYFGIAQLIENHIASELVGGSASVVNEPVTAFPEANDSLQPPLGALLPV